jgi:hypothetical protein
MSKQLTEQQAKAALLRAQKRDLERAEMAAWNARVDARWNRYFTSQPIGMPDYTTCEAAPEVCVER